MGTPKRKTAAAVMRSPAQSLIGASVVIPPAIFPEDNAQYTGTVTGTPSRRKNAVYVKVDQDATQYWFPASEVSKWVVGENPATTASRTPKKARHQRQRPEDSSQQTPTASQTADVDDQTATQAEAPAELTVNNSPAPAAACLHDASSCHPQPHDDFTDTLEGLAATSAQELHDVPAAVQVRGVFTVAALAAVIPVATIVWQDLSQYLLQYFSSWR